MAFVPEGQADSSQARSAWVAMGRGRVPEGRSKSLSVPQIFVVATEPRHVANDSASNAHAASETPGIPVELKGLLASNLSRDPFNRPFGTRSNSKHQYRR